MKGYRDKDFFYKRGKEWIEKKNKQNKEMQLEYYEKITKQKFDLAKANKRSKPKKKTPNPEDIYKNE